MQRKAIAHVALFAYLPALLVVAASALQPGIPLRVLYEDPAAMLQVPFFVGLLSNTGVVIWAATAAICLFSWELLRRVGADRSLMRFLLASGLLTGYMMWDDLIMLHERLYPIYLSITEGWAKTALLVAIFAYLFFFRATILRSEYALLGISLAFLGSSFVVDVSFIQSVVKQVMPFDERYYYVLEDGPKLLGIVGWFAYFTRFAQNALMGRLASGANSPDAERGNGAHRQLQQDETRAQIG